MDDARQIRQRFEDIMQRMGKSVRLNDSRLESSGSAHRGYKTRGAGADAGWEFRFLELPGGLQAGSILSLEGDGAFKLTAEDAMQVALRPSTPDDTVMGSLGIVLPLPCI